MAKLIVGIHGLANKQAEDVELRDWSRSIAEGLLHNVKRTRS